MDATSDPIRTVRRRLRALGVSGRVPVQELAQALSDERRKSLRLVPVTLPCPVNGAVLITRQADVLCYADGWRMWVLHTIAHELSHLLLGHRGTELGADDTLRMLAPEIEPADVRRLLGRITHSTAEERAAEIAATYLVGNRLLDVLPTEEWIGHHLLRTWADGLMLPGDS
ncbi:hypothetical protein [Amycolatopsis arida]|nr:hypothetical protein [Amycolatopsis arida]